LILFLIGKVIAGFYYDLLIQLAHSIQTIELAVLKDYFTTNDFFSKDLDITVTSSAKNETILIKDFQVEDFQDCFKVLVHTKESQRSYTLMITSKNQSLR